MPEVVVPLSFYDRAPKKPRGRYAARLNAAAVLVPPRDTNTRQWQRFLLARKYAEGAR
jgi:hypothetical protein